MSVFIEDSDIMNVFFPFPNSETNVTYMSKDKLQAIIHHVCAYFFPEKNGLILFKEILDC